MPNSSVFTRRVPKNEANIATRYSGISATTIATSRVLTR